MGPDSPVNQLIKKALAAIRQALAAIRHFLQLYEQKIKIYDNSLKLPRHCYQIINVGQFMLSNLLDLKETYTVIWQEKISVFSVHFMFKL